MPVERSSTMGPKQKKSTRKFERKHLGDALVRRKAAKVAAQRRRAKEMRLAAAMTEGAETGEADESEEEEDEAAAAAAARPGAKKRLEDMTLSLIHI